MACQKCFRDRKLRRCFGPGLHPKGVELCRPCWQIVKLKGFLKDESGQDLVEYALIVAAVALALITTVTTLSGGINSLYQSITGRLTGVEWQEASR